MSKYISTAITLGYGGGAHIKVNGGAPKEVNGVLIEDDLCWVFMNSGNLTKNINVPNFIGYNMELELSR